MEPILYIVIPCYNEQEVLPITAPMFLKKLQDLYSIKKELANGKDDSAMKRLREVEDELLITGRVLENYG